MPKKKVVIEEKSAPPETRPQKTRLLQIIVALILLVGLFLWKNKSLVMVANVDGTPIWRPAFEQRIISQYGTNTVNAMIDEQIILNEAKKRGIAVSQTELDQKISEIKKTLPQGTTLESALAERKLTLDDLKNNLTIQISAEKIMKTLPAPTEKQIAAYLETNKEFLTATDEGTLTLQARQALENEAFQKFFQELQKKAKISRYL